MEETSLGSYPRPFRESIFDPPVVDFILHSLSLAFDSLILTNGSGLIWSSLCVYVCAGICFIYFFITWQASHLTAPPPVVRSLLTVQPLPRQRESGKTTWNNLKKHVSERQAAEWERLDHFPHHLTCHGGAGGGSPFCLWGAAETGSTVHVGVEKVDWRLWCVDQRVLKEADFYLTAVLWSVFNI